ncbi:MAG: barstar family protein, partial [Clostridia bacterium]|nr:barstar family protein [Clostridia bacterium]
MKTVILDAAKLDGMRGVHEIFRDTLGFPDYYGYNLDALYDCLTDLQEETEIVIPDPLALSRELGKRYGRLMAVLCDAA